MAVELATAYISLVPSFRGVGSAMQRELVRPARAAGADAGDAAGRSFKRNFDDGVKKGGSAGVAKRLATTFRDQIASAGKPILITLGTALSTSVLGSMGQGLASGAVNLAHGFGAAIALLPAAAGAAGLAIGTLALAMAGHG